MKNILNKPVDIKLALALYVMVLVLGSIIVGVSSCRSSKEIAAENERRRQHHIALLEETRKEHPCDTFRTYSVDTLLQFVPGDTIRIGQQVIIHDTAMLKRTIVKFVLDSAWLQQYRDSLASVNYAFDLAREDATAQAKRADRAETLLTQLKGDKGYWQRAAIITWCFLSVLIGGAIFSKIKGII